MPTEDENPFVKVTVDMPKQVTSITEMQQLQETGKLLKDLLTTQFFTTFGLSLIIKSVLGQFWSMMNMMQLLTALPLLDIKMPSNVLEVRAQILGIMNSQPFS